SVVTFGCRVNQADSLTVEEGFLAHGAIAAEAEGADIVVVNTCSVTASADQAARQTIRRIARINPGAKIVVTGCYATRRSDEVVDLPGVMRVVPNDQKSQLMPLILRDLTTADRFGDGDGSCGSALEPGIAGRTAFTLCVQTGCAEECSYCIIPTTRGRPSSVPIEGVLAEVERVKAAGFKEIALTGVHLGSYGRDLQPRSSLVDLLERLAEESCSDVLFRISSLEPMDCTPEIVDLVASAGCFAPHFHLPLQHASNRMLAAMRRPYTIEYYCALVDVVRSRIPHASIGSDVIVGFPGETDDDFVELSSYLESSPLTHVHVFPYSDRTGTLASTRRDKVPGAIVRERARMIREIGQRLAVAFGASQVGSVHRGLTLEDGSLVVTGNYLKVRVPPGRTRNEWVSVRLTSEHGGELLSG
ncbi:MAG: MiaB/RimO family radical SAM methylthiotransferase, partial [Vicinamibacterales bacterium]|nr:MiaB/RimO family radical SAM methylthiotransferase [Vicinamibacterales bacterium]